MNVLHIDSSIQGEGSVSRKVSAAIVARLRAANPDLRVTYRDVVAEPLPQLSGALAATLGAPADRVPDEHGRDAAELRAALDEVLAADVIVVGAPMYNFGIPSQLKAWIDALAVAGTTFRYSPAGFEGLLGGKRFIIASAQGGTYRAGTPDAAMEHQESHLRSFFAFLGATQLQTIRADGIKSRPASDDHGLTSALKQLEGLRNR